MPTSRLFAYNTGSPILGTTQVGSIAISESPSLNYSQGVGGVRWWNGPNEDLGYVITHTTPSGTQPNPDNVPAYIGFWRSPLKTENSLITFTNGLFGTSHTTGDQCKTWLNANGYWTSWVGSGGGFVPGDFDFTFLSGTADGTNTVTFTKTGSLYLQLDVTAEPELFTVMGWVNGVSIQNVIRWYTTQADAISYKQTVAISNFGYSDPIASGYAGGRPYAVIDIVSGNTMTLQMGDGGGGYDPGAAYGTSLSFKNGGFAGTVVDTLVGFKSAGCYLTTTMVQYKGLLDDGPELIAMRQLREHYRGDAYYDNGLIEYYANSQSIIDGINASVDPSIDYEFIYQSVLKVKNYVDQSMWKEAIDEYIDTYFILKNRYI